MAKSQRTHCTNRTLRVAGTGGTVLAIGALAALGAPAIAHDEGAAEPEKRSFAAAGDRLTIDSDHAGLAVRAADVDEIQVTRHVSGSAAGAEPEAAWQLAGDTLTLNADCDAFYLGTCGARYEVLVPENIAVTVDGGSGQISAAGFDTGLRLHSDTGNVTVDDVSGPLALSSRTGRLQATGVTSSQVEAEARSGNVDLSFAGVPGRVAAESKSSAVTIEVPEDAYRVTAETDTGKARSHVAEDADSRHVLTGRSDTGDVTLRTTP